MTYFHIGGEDWKTIIILVVVALIVMAFASWGSLFFLKRSENKKELITRRVKILECTSGQTNVRWYVVESDSGERFRLRSFQANSIIIQAGDTGMISYRGKTIQSFQRG